MNEVISLDSEEWKDINGYEGIYQVSSFGRIKSLPRKVIKSNGRTHTVNESIRKPHETKDGYLRIRLSNGENAKSLLIHRIVAEHFIENINSKLEVNHLDEDKKNNHVTNLEWCTRQENMEYSSWCYNRMHEANFKKVFSIDNYGVKTLFESIKDMAENLDIKIPTAHTYVQNSRKMSRGRFEGWVFGYEKDN